MLTVACVLKGGGEYRPEHVLALRDGVVIHLPAPHQFVCLSDMPAPGVNIVPLAHGWPGWWSKIELFRPDLFCGPTLFFDLDTVLVGDLSEIAETARLPLVGLADFNRPERFASGVMAWCADLAQLYHEFARDPQGYMRQCGNGGDQAYIGGQIDTWQTFQGLAPGQIVSYKKHCTTGVPDGARVVCAHGRPKPWHPEWKL